MEQKEYLGILKSKSAYIITQEEEVLSVEKKDNPTFKTNVKIQHYNLSDKFIVNSTTEKQSHITTSIYLLDRVLVINSDVNITAGWHIRTVFLEIDDKRYECGSGIAETGVYFAGYNKPYSILKDVLDSHIGNNGISIKHTGTDLSGRKSFAVLVPEFGSYPEDYPIRKCNLTLILLWIVIPIIYFYLAGFLSSFDSAILKFICNIKKFAPIYFTVTILFTIIISRISKKYKKSRSSKIAMAQNAEKEQVYAGTGHSPNESFEEAFSGIINKANRLFCEYLKIPE